MEELDNLVAGRLQSLHTALLEFAPLGWSAGTCAAVLEALEDAVRPHQPEPAYDFLQDAWGSRCQLCLSPWPCPTYRRVRDTLEGLL